MIQEIQGQASVQVLEGTEEKAGKDACGREFVQIEDFDDADLSGYEKSVVSTVFITNVLFLAAIACLVSAFLFPMSAIPLFLAVAALSGAAILMTPVNIILYAGAKGAY